MSKIFGGKPILKSYGWKQFCKDSWLPFVIAIGLCVSMYSFDAEIMAQLKYLLSIGLSTLPTVVAIMLAAYVFALSFFNVMLKKFSDANWKMRTDFIKTLNSGFAFYALSLLATIAIMIVFSCLVNIGFMFWENIGIQYTAYWLVAFSFAFSIYAIWGIVLTLFNIGQTYIIPASNDRKSNKDDKAV